MNAQPLVTLLVPVFNEEAAIPFFLQKVEPVLAGCPSRFEILFVNDGSRDGTAASLAAAAASDPRVRILELSRNFGKEAAMTAGLDHAEGDAVIPIDVDLQDPPELIPLFIDKWLEGFAVVYGQRRSRRSESWLRQTTARLYYGFYNSLSPVKIPSNVGDFRLMDRSVVEVLRRLPERNRFMKGLFAWAGFPSACIPYERPQRAAGTSKWSYWKLWNFALDGLLSFSTVPLRVWSYLGALIALCSLAFGAYVMGQTLLFGRDVPGYASLMTALSFLGGIQLISLGIIGEYIGRIFLEVKGRPLYVLRQSTRGGAHSGQQQPPLQGD